ncbi:MAG: hypothetical protein WBC75_09880 [Dehalococcoidales bacterium]
MKKKTLSMLMVLAALILIVPAGIVDAKAQPQDIAFSMVGDWSEEGFDPDTGNPVDVDYDAAVSLSGKTSEKSGSKYLSPLHGILDVEGTEYKIQVKALKQSEPLYVDETRIDLPYFPPYWLGGYIISSTNSGIIEANIEGSKFIGWLEWHLSTQYDADDNIVDTSGGSTFILFGIVDGKSVTVTLDGDAPEIN